MIMFLLAFLSLSATTYTVTPYIDYPCEFSKPICEPYKMDYPDSEHAIYAQDLTCLHIKSKLIFIKYGDKCYCITPTGEKINNISGRIWKHKMSLYGRTIGECWIDEDDIFHRTINIDDESINIMNHMDKITWGK